MIKQTVKMIPKNSNRKFKSKNVKLKGYYTLILFLLLLLFDRITKIWASNLDASKDYGILAFTYVTNTGAGFSMLQNMNIMLVIVSIAALILLVYFNKHIPRFSLITIISGITGNLTDRIFYGSVIDFINLKFWPVFNIADSLICIGVIYWIIFIIKDERNPKVKK
jgi:signal peptidase II